MPAYVPVVVSVMVLVMVRGMAIAVDRAWVGLAAPQVPREGLDEAGARAAAGLGLLEAVDDVAQVDGSVLLVLLVRPALDARRVDVALLEGVQERVDLLLDLVQLLLLVPKSLRDLDHAGQDLDRRRLRRQVFVCRSLSLTRRLVLALLSSEEVRDAEDLVAEDDLLLAVLVLLGVPLR